MKRFLVILAIVAGVFLVWGTYRAADSAFAEVEAQNTLKRAEMRVSDLWMAMDVYYLNQMAVAPDLHALVVTGAVTPAQLLDPWNHTMRLLRPADGSTHLCSAGPDGSFDTSDDVCRARAARPHSAQE